MPDPRYQPGGTSDATPRSASDRRRILIVDDSSSVRGIVREGLETHAACACEEAANGVEAIAKAKKFMPDLVVLDLAMPKLNGFEVATVLQRELPKIPIVLLTMYAEELGRSLANSVGVSAVISKADGMGALIHCVQNLLGV
jgi:two-component system, NarL family, invasion response regulator UvrY